MSPTPARQPPAQPEPLGFISTAELEALTVPPVEWLIEDVLPRGLVSSMIAASGTGKTWLALAMCRLFATGGKFAGHAVTKCRAGFLDLEDDWIALKQRWAQMNSGMGPLPAEDLLASVILPRVMSGTGALNVMEAGWADRLLASARGFDVLIIDSLSKCHVFDENSTADMSLVLNTLIGIARASGCTLLLIHHTGWSVPGQRKVQRGRGASVIRDNSQHEIFLAAGDDGGAVRVVLTKAKRGPRIDVGRMTITGTRNGPVEIAVEEPNAPTPTQLRHDTILELLRDKGALSYTALRDATCKRTGHGKASVEEMIKRMADAGSIVQPTPRGAYQLV